jgi:hypothetical protein
VGGSTDPPYSTSGCNFPKFNVPKPVSYPRNNISMTLLARKTVRHILTGSHPTVASNPSVSQPGFVPPYNRWSKSCEHNIRYLYSEEARTTMSTKPATPLEYKNGLRNPREERPCEIL